MASSVLSRNNSPRVCSVGYAGILSAVFSASVSNLPTCRLQYATTVKKLLCWLRLAAYCDVNVDCRLLKPNIYVYILFIMAFLAEYICFAANA